MSEAYATLVYGDTPLACAAAVLGIGLRELDASRDRVAIVRAISPRVRSILLSAGWRLHEVARKRLPQRQYVRDLTRKNELWRLPYKRVLYMDADTYLLPAARGAASSRSLRLRMLWDAFPLDTVGSVAATGIRPHFYANDTLTQTCFNGGFIMLKPDAATARRLDGIDAHRARQEPEAATGRRCPGFDQPLLNRAFGPSAWQRIGDAQWRSITHWVASPDHPSVCGLTSRDALLRSADAYHFFHKVNPWENVNCVLCVKGGMRCRPVVPIGHECAVHALTQTLWWQALLRALPANETSSCLALTEQVSTDVAGVPSARKAKLKGRLCTGCSKRPTPACVAASTDP